MSFDVSSTAVAVAATAICVGWSVWRARRTENPNNLPPSPPGLPVLGHLHLLGSRPHISITALQKEVGPVMLLKLGVIDVIVVSDPELAKDVLLKSGAAIADRPMSATWDIVSHSGKDVALAPYGAYWRKARRICHQELFTPARLADMASTIVSEVALTLNKVEEASKEGPVVFRSFAKLATTNIMMQTLFNARFESVHDEAFLHFEKVVESLFNVVSVANPADYIPILKILPNGHLRKTKELTAARDEYLLGWIELNRQKLEKNPNTPTSNYAQHLLKVQEKEELTDMEIMTILADMLLAGIDTSGTTVQWMIGLAANNPECVKKAQAEIDAIVGPDRLVTYDDHARLPYTEAFIAEVMRVWPVGPFLLPHATVEDVALGPYQLPKGIQVWVNSWAIARDPKLWSSPEEFRPERFVDGHPQCEMKDNDKEGVFAPFGRGRRGCVGRGLAEMTLLTFIANLLRAFDFAPPAGTSKIVFHDLFGLTLQPGDYAVQMTRRPGINIPLD